MRQCEIFINKRGELLGNHGYIPDPGRLRVSNQNITFYHYTRKDKVDKILSADEGLFARLSVVLPPFDLEGLNFIEGLLDPLPRWITESPYFGDLGLEMFKEFVGDFLLEIKIPQNFPGIYIADYAHVLECKHVLRRNNSVLNLGYNCKTGKESCKADVNSYIPALSYQGGHIAPELKVTRKGPGIVIPSKYITICNIQPLL